MDLIFIAISATFVNNILLAQYLGNCPFLGVSKKIETAIGMAAAILFVTILASIFTWSVFTYVLRPYDLEFLQTLTFILIIASLVQLVEIILKKKSRTLYNALGVYLPLITTNCAVMGVALLIPKKEMGFAEMLVFSSCSAIGYGLALILFAGIRERLLVSPVPQNMQGTSIALVTAGIMALAFMGFQGMAS
ncbi:MAG: RnfABCDGE type electron transport complex subunit A [Desulfobulbaceae bacterium]|nr:RnfABCDGE type electron transport complex subunit A [Desulfobulbaceae bacterium]